LSNVFTIYSLSVSLLPRRKIQIKILGLREEVCSARYCNSEYYFLPVSVVKKSFGLCKLHWLQEAQLRY